MRADVDDLHQIIYNLTENAIKYNRPGGFVRVTLGGTGKDVGKRHPTLGNNVMVGSGAKVLGPFRVGDNARIAANAVVLREVPPGATVVGVPGRIVRLCGDKLDHIHTPDPVMLEIEELKRRMALLEEQINDTKKET